MSHPIRQDGRRRQLLRLPGMHFHFGLSGVILTPFSGQPAQDNRRALIAEARNFAAATLSEGRDNHDMAYFQPALEASEIYLKLRPYLKGNFHQVLRGRILIASASSQSRVPGIASAFIHEIERLEKEWHLI